MSGKRKVLILHTSIGHGIKITAQNVYERLKNSSEFEVRIDDLYEVAPGSHVVFLQRLYFYFTETFPFIWGVLYSDLIATITIPFRKFTASFKYKRILKLIESFRPDIVVSTETVPSGITAYLKHKGWYKGKLVIVFSDYHLHRFWLYDEADLYLCNIPEQRDALLGLGVAAEKIALTGMIVSEKYKQIIPRPQACKAFGLDSALPTVLVSGGRRGLVASKTIVQGLLASVKTFQIVVVAGLNQRLKRELKKLSSSSGHDLKILGYITNQDILMSAADILISKPGGPTIAEAVAKGLSIVITDAHPGHETKNMEYLVRQNIASHARKPEEAVILVEQILSGQTKLDKEKAYEKIIKPVGTISLTQALERLNIRS